MTKKVFIAKNGVKRTFYYREGTNDESTIIAVYEEDYYQLLTELFKKDDVIIDLGAHIGALSILASTTDIPLKIIAVEAVWQNCEIFRMNIKENNLNISLYENAIWSKSGLNKKIYYGDDSESGQVHKFIGTMDTTDTKAFTTKFSEIETITLEDIFKKEKIEECQFLKCDIEGAEEEAIAKAPDDILKRIILLRGEYHFGNYNKLLEKTRGIFEDTTPNDMNPIKESLTEFLWRKKHAR